MYEGDEQEWCANCDVEDLLLNDFSINIYIYMEDDVDWFRLTAVLENALGLELSCKFQQTVVAHVLGC